MAKDLVIKISGDVDEYKAALNQAGQATEELSAGLEKVAAVGAVAFAAFTAEVFLSVDALNVEADSLARVNLALQNQGIFTTKLAADYRKVAEAIEAKTGIDADQISKAQASAQALFGQTTITEELTRATVDFAAAQEIDVVQAFEIVGKAVQGHTQALQKQGIEIDANATKQERIAQILDGLRTKYDGFAEATASTTGSTKLLESAFGNLQKEIGRRFAPAFDAVVGALTKFINVIKDNKVILDFTASIVAGGVAFGASALAIAGLAKAYGIYRTVLAASTVTQAAANAMLGGSAVGAISSATLSISGLITALRSASIATKALVGATGIGLLVVIASEIYLNWNTIWPRVTAIFRAFTQNIIDLASGMSKIVVGALMFSPAGLKLIEEGFKQAGDAAKRGWETATATIKTPEQITSGEGQDANKAGAAGKAEAKATRQDTDKLATRKAELELLRLEEEKASEEMLRLKRNEVDLLKKIEEEKDDAIRAALERRLTETRAREAEQIKIDAENKRILNEELLAKNEEFQQLNEEQKRAFLERNQAILQEGILNEQTAREKAILDELEAQKRANNTFLLEQRKYGVAYATINRAMHSEVFQGTKTAFGELAALQQSSNSTLKTIGKIAAVANITIRTAEAAMNIYAGFSTIPIIGPVLGTIGAAAAIAFGAEQIGRVNAAADGALVTGGTPGKDSVPFLLAPGEVVAPERNFEEVIGSVAATRAAKDFLPTGNTGGEGNAKMLAALTSIDEKLSQGQQPQIVVNGDMLSDQVWIERLGKALSDAIEFGNLKIFGVNV